MKIAALGAVCFDEIFLVDGTQSESFGGITYNAAALSSILEPGDTALPVSNLGEDRYEAALAEFSKLPNVDTSALVKTPGPLMHVTLTWRSASWRDEAVRHQMPPFDGSVADRLAGCDAAHINFIHGTEVDLDTLRAVRERFDGLLSLDVHNIISRFGKDGTRSIVGFQQWREWTPYLDILQCNEFEIDQMFPRSVASRDEFARAAREVCATGPRVVSVTLGPEDAVTVHRKDDKYYLLDIGVLPPVKAVDSTGCGDSFSAGFLVGMVRYDDPATALACATVVAGVNARHRGIGSLEGVQELLADPRSHFALFEGKPADWPGEQLD